MKAAVRILVESADALVDARAEQLRRAGNVENLSLRVESQGECGRLF